MKLTKGLKLYKFKGREPTFFSPKKQTEELPDHSSNISKVSACHTKRLEGGTPNTTRKVVALENMIQVFHRLITKSTTKCLNRLVRSRLC